MSKKLKGMMRALPLILLLGAVMTGQAFSEVTPASFVKPTSNFQPMNIFFYGFNYNGVTPKKGDKIGIFDGELCVGVQTLTKNYSDFPPDSLLHVLAYKEFKEGNVVKDPGFKEGNPIKYYLLVSSTNTVVPIPDANVMYLDPLSGEPMTEPMTFLGLGTAVVKIHSGLAKLSISINPAGKGNTTPKADDYLYGIDDAQQVTIAVDPAATAEHYEFTHWLVDGVPSTDSQVTVTMTQNIEVVANYALKNYTLTPAVDPSVGSTVPEAPTPVPALTWVDIFAKPNQDSGYEFSHWSVDPANAQIEDANQASTRIYMDKNVQATAVFKLQKDSLTIAVNPPGSGTTTPAAGQMHVYDFGQAVTLVANPQSGWKFKHWLDKSSDTPTVMSTDSSYSFLIKKKTDVEAVFEKKQYQVRLRTEAYMGAVHINFNGSDVFAPADSLYTLAFGTQIWLKAVSNDAGKYPFANWSGAINTPNNPVSVVVNTSMLIVANFEDTTPVELSSFTVQYAPRSVSRAVLLRWDTVTETNNFGFEVERAFGAEKNWSKVGFVKGAGTTSQPKQYQYLDDGASEAGVYFYRLRQIDTDGTVEYSKSVKFEVTAPSEYALQQNYPNPFNPTTNIVFQVKEEGHVNLAVYDLLGRQVMTLVDETMKAGTHRIAVDASELSAGIYFYGLTAGSFSEMKKMTLIK